MCVLYIIYAYIYVNIYYIIIIIKVHSHTFTYYIDEKATELSNTFRT